MHVTATEAKNRFGYLCAQAKTEPVIVEKDGRSDSVIVAYEDFQALRIASEKKTPAYRQKESNETYKDWFAEQNCIAKQYGVSGEEWRVWQVMPQFDVYENPSVAQRVVFPFLVQIQNEQLSIFSTRRVMPLQHLKVVPSALPRRLSQSVLIEGENLYRAAHFVAAIHTKMLGRPVAGLVGETNVILDALDAVVSGG